MKPQYLYRVQIRPRKRGTIMRRWDLHFTTEKAAREAGEGWNPDTHHVTMTRYKLVAWRTKGDTK